MIKKKSIKFENGPLSCSLETIGGGSAHFKPDTNKEVNGAGPEDEKKSEKICRRRRSG